MPAIVYKGKEIAYSITESKRKTLGIYVHPNLQVEVRVPSQTPQIIAEERLLKNKRWVYRQLKEFEKFHPGTVERKYTSGETHKYLGKQYVLKVELHSKESKVALKGSNIVVRAPAESLVKDLLTTWYKEKAFTYLKKRFNHWQKTLINEIPIEANLVIKPLQKSWGLCKGDVITLNSELIKTPRVGVDYVIIHELCHLKVPYHNEHFHALLSKYLPEWKKHKEILEKSYV